MKALLFTNKERFNIVKRIYFKYDVGDEILIKEINRTGHIDGLFYGMNGRKYQVVFWDNGSRHILSLYDWEITKK